MTSTTQRIADIRQHAADGLISAGEATRRIAQMNERIRLIIYVNRVNNRIDGGYLVDSEKAKGEALTVAEIGAHIITNPKVRVEIQNT